MADATNTNAINFPTPSGDWAVPTQFAIYDLETAGVEKYRDDL